MNDRDQELAAALAELEVPDHAPDFFTNLRTRLDAEGGTTVVPLAQPVRRRWRRQALRVAVVGAAAGVVAAAISIGPGGSPIAPRPATAAEVIRTVQQAVAGVETLRGTVIIRSLDRPDQPLDEMRWRFVTNAAGDFRLTGVSRPEDSAYTADTGVERSWSRAPDGSSFAAERRGMAIGHPDEGPASWVLARDVSATLRALAAAEDPAVEETTYDGRPAWSLETAVRANMLSDRSGNHLEVVVDKRIGLPVRIVESKDGTVLREVRLDDLVVDGPVSDADFTLTPPPGVPVVTSDAGWRRVELRDAPASVGYRPLVPARMPDGYELTHVVVADESGPTGVEGINPPTRKAVQLGYRRGLDLAIVTMRLRDVPGGISEDVIERCRECLGDSPWSDPLASGEGFVDDPEELTVAAGALAGAPAQLLIDPRTIPHVWALGEQLVVTVSGDLSEAELVSVLESLAPLE